MLGSFTEGIQPPKGPWLNFVPDDFTKSLDFSNLRRLIFLKEIVQEENFFSFYKEICYLLLHE